MANENKNESKIIARTRNSRTQVPKDMAIELDFSAAKVASLFPQLSSCNNIAGWGSNQAQMW